MFDFNMVISFVNAGECLYLIIVSTLLQSTYVETATDEQRERMRNSFNATAESVKRDVRQIIEWAKKQPHLPEYTDEDVIAHCLLLCKNSLEKTKRSLENYSYSRALYPEIFCDRNPHEKFLEDQQNHSMYVPLRKLTPDGYRVAMLYITDDAKATMPPPENFIKINQMAIELLAKVDYVSGVILINDLANFRMIYFTSISSHLQKMIFLQQNSTPIRYKKIYIINMVPVGDIALKFIKPFISKKLANRIKILKKPTNLCKVLPKEIIPREYGGDELPLKQLKDLWFEDLKNNYDYLKSIENLATDLSKLPKDFATTELSGTVGSFRQISID